MPIVNVLTARGLLSAEQKSELHTALTDVMVRIEGGGDPDFRQYVLVLIEEHEAQAWSVAGQPLTGQVVNTLAARQSQPPVPAIDGRSPATSRAT
jgi:4-oxalocrotonate tautomerase